MCMPPFGGFDISVTMKEYLRGFSADDEHNINTGFSLSSIHTENVLAW